MAMEVDRLTVKVDTDFRGLTSGLKSATSQVQGFKREVESTQAELGKGGDFPVRTDTTQVDAAKSKVGALFQEISKGGTYEVRADDSQLTGVSGLLAAIRADVANSPTYRLNVDDSGITGLGVSLDRIRQDAANGGTFKLDADITGLAGATTAIQAIKAESASADDTIKITADVDEGAATTKLAAFQGLVSWFDGKEINMPIDINTVSSIAGLFSVQAAVLSLGAQLLGLSVSSDIASGSLTGLGAAGATAAVGLVSLGAAVVAIVSAVEIVQTLGVAVLGAGAAFVGLGAGAVAGLGLVAGAIYALTQAQGTLGEAFAELSDHASNLYYDFQAAFEPAAALIPPIGDKALDVAQNYIPLLGTAAEATIGAMTPVFNSFLTWLDEGGAGFQFMSTIIEGATPIMAALSDTVVSLLQGFVAMAATATPAAIELADSIAAIAQRFAEWATSAEGQEQILGWIDTAKIIFPAIRDAIVEIVGAFSSLEGFDAESLASGIRGIGSAIAGIIGFIGTVKQGWDAFDAAINATLDFIVSWIPEVNLLDKIMGDTGGLDAGALIESLSTAWTTVTDWIAGLVPEVSLWDVLVGDATIQEGAEGGSPAAALIATLQGAYDSVIDWMAGLAPEVSLWDVLVGDASVAQAAEGGSPAATLIETLQGAYDSVIEWIGGLVPEVSLWDVLVGDASVAQAAEGGSPAAALIEALQGVWDSVMSWLGGLVPDISLVDIITGGEEAIATVNDWWASVSEAFSSGWATISTAVSDFFTTLYNDYWLYYFGADGVLATGLIDFFSVLYNDYWLYYFGADGVLVTGLLDFFTTLYNDYWLYYFGADGVLVTGLLDFFTTLYNDYWLYYFGLDGVLVTGLIDFFTSLYNDYWLYYFGLDGVLITGILDFFTSLYNDYWLYYFGLDGVLVTGIIDFFTSLYNDYWLYYFGLDGILIGGIIDFFTSLYNDYWLYYFGTDGALIGPIIEFFTTLYNDYFLYYLGEDGVVVTAVQAAWDAILTAIPEFVRSFGNLLGNGLAAGINAGIGYLEGLLTAINAVLTAIGATNITATLPRVEFQEFASGGSTESMAAGGSRGGAGSRGKQPRHIVWNEGMGEEYWIATGPAADKRKNVGWLAKAAGALGLGVVPMQAGGVIGSGGRLAGISRTLERLQPAYLAREFPDETATTDRATTTARTTSAVGAAATATGTKKLSHRQKRRAHRRERRQGTATTTGLTGTTPTTTPTTPISGTTGTTPVTGTPSSTAGMAAPAGVTRSPTLTGGSGTGRRSGAARGRLGARKRGGARFSNVHHRKRRGGAGGRHHRATGGPVFMAIGGGTDLGPAGLSGEAASIADEIMNAYGVWANTYVGGDTPHGSLHGNVPENTFDFWGDSGFSPLDIGTGDAIKAYLYDKYGSDLDTVIWQGVGENQGGFFDDDDHYDHLHASVGGGGIMNTAGVLAAALFNKIKGIWDSAMSALGSVDMGEGEFWDGVETYLMTLPALAWEWLKAKIPRGTGGSLAGMGRGGAPLSGDLSSMAEQAIQAAGWPASELAALTDLWQNESGWDANIVNPDSGAYGIPQINPASWGTPVPLGDAAAQIAWGVDYIADTYGSPTDALNFWLANGWYATGGVVPGAPGTPQSAVVHGGERVLPRNINRGFESLAKSVERWDGSEASGMGGTGANSEAEAVLEDILVEIKRGNDNPTPVDINNMTDMQRSFVTGFMAGIDSDVTTEKLDQKMAEGVRFASALGGL